MKTPPEYDCGDEITVELDLLSKRPNVKFFRNGDKKITTENRLFIKKKKGAHLNISWLLLFIIKMFEYH